MKVFLCILLYVIFLIVIFVLFELSTTFAGKYALKFKTNKIKSALAWLIIAFWTIYCIWGLYFIGIDLASSL